MQGEREQNLPPSFHGVVEAHRYPQQWPQHAATAVMQKRRRLCLREGADGRGAFAAANARRYSTNRPSKEDVLQARKEMAAGRSECRAEVQVARPEAGAPQVRMQRGSAFSQQNR